MPIPIIIGVAAGAAALYGAVKGVSGAMDQSKAKDINADARSIADEANASVEEKRQTTSKVLEKYGKRKITAFDGVISDFIHTFGRLKNVDAIHTPELQSLGVSDFSGQSLTDLRNDYQALKDAGFGLGAGLGSGAALAFGAYNGTMLLAAAGTGTAISSLSGVAATNATLAWLGGGTLAAGGGGIALGTMVLGGIVAGPALAIFGHIMGNKGEEALNNAHGNMEQARTIRDEAKLTVAKLQAITQVSTLASEIFQQVTIQLRRSVDNLAEVIAQEGANYQKLTPGSKKIVIEAVKFAQLIKAMIDTPILDKDGSLVLSTKKRIEDIQTSIHV
ncbi:hypothetical protein [Comamonas testosteroni]|uniref:hypothetical protein n=1 Tax=Comamonas testosteroni TaxID=285 RepID=UPI0026EA81B9|nr:hypothetical protein [Comamonas testosteroni]